MLVKLTPDRRTGFRKSEIENLWMIRAMEIRDTFDRRTIVRTFDNPLGKLTLQNRKKV